jgi:hypothetical protein
MRYTIFVFVLLLISCQQAEPTKEELVLDTPKLKAILTEMAKTDKLYRLKASTLRAQNNGIRTSEEGELWAQQKLVDSINMNQLELIFSKVGYPGKSLVGDTLEGIAAMVVMHNPSRQAKYVDLMWQAAKNGDIKLMEAAMLEDRVKMFAGAPQKYGTQMKYDTISINSKTKVATTELHIWPIAEIDKVDSLRRAIGLYPLSQQCQMMGVDCDKVKGYRFLKQKIK